MGYQKETLNIKNKVSQESEPFKKMIESPIINNIQPKILEEKTIHTSTRENINIPSLDEFMNFAKSLEIYDETMDFAIKSKYESWRDNGWVNGLGIPINKWQNNLKNTLPHLKTSKKKPSGLQPNNIPTIKRPKQTYNE
mgnify:FL=1